MTDLQDLIIKTVAGTLHESGLSFVIVAIDEETDDRPVISGNTCLLCVRDSLIAIIDERNLEHGHQSGPKKSVN